MFDKWYTYTREASIHEFTSPTYTWVQLTALYAGYLFAARPVQHRQFKNVLDLIWSDTAASDQLLTSNTPAGLW